MIDQQEGSVTLTMAAIKQRMHRYTGSSYDDIYLSANVGDVVGTLAVANGGTGKTGAEAALYAFLNSGAELGAADLATGDLVLLGDVSGTTCTKVTVDNIRKYLKTL